jgi:uncharacterized membrane protein (DUF106 family)
MIFKRIVKFLDKLEDKIRGKLSHYPIIYALVGGIGVVLFWRGIWHTADMITYYFISSPMTLTVHEVLDGPVSFIIGTLILLITGVFVSSFIGNRLIISGLVGEKKLAEKEVDEIETEETQLENLQNTLSRLEKKLDHIDDDQHK